MSKHTPGEWQIGFGVTRLEIHEASGKMIATVPRDDKYGAIPSSDIDAYDYTDRTAVSTDCASVPK